MRPTGSGARTSSPTPLQQMKNACKLPVAVAGALMPDAHVGYGLPIGGVLATRGRGHSRTRSASTSRAG